jgi:hypothetical protein
MSSREARDAILSQHERLRKLLADTVALADSAWDAARRLARLHTHARNLYAALDEHMAFEEELLPSALRDVIGWGPQLQTEIEKEHDRQRAALDSAVAALGLPATDLVDRLRVLADALLADMTLEEKRLLRADIDAIPTDTQGG